MNEQEPPQVQFNMIEFIMDIGTMQFYNNLQILEKKFTSKS